MDDRPAELAEATGVGYAVVDLETTGGSAEGGSMITEVGAVTPAVLAMSALDTALDIYDAAHKLEVAVAPSHGYFPAHTFGEARIVTRPQTMPWGTRECRIIDPDGHTWVITQVQR